MTFDPFGVDAVHLAYAVLGGFVVILGMFSLVIKEKLYIGEAPLATVFGIIIGPYAIGLFDPRSWGQSGSRDTAGVTSSVSNSITLEVTRVTLAIGVFAIGAELPKQYMKKHWRSLALLLGPVMTLGWIISAALIYGFIPKLSFLSSLVIAACLTPTDPILAAAVVGGKFAIKHVPAHLRHLIAAESAANDGAAFPFLYLGLYLTLESSAGHAVGEWFYLTWLYSVVMGVGIGALIGYGFRHLMKFSERKNLIDRTSYVAQYISLALLSIGCVTLLGSDDLLAAFACGTAFAWDGWFNRQTEESHFSDVIDLLFNCVCFIYIGAWIPFKDFNRVDLSVTPWRLVVIAILILLLRRLPAFMACYKWIPDIRTFREALFSGHFGPMGVGAVFICSFASSKLPSPVQSPNDQVELLASSVQPIVAFVVLTSIVVHGLSIPFFSLGRRVHSITYTYTYSRRQSVDPAAPDWINQVRRIPSKHAREDIVINRDEDEGQNEKGPVAKMVSLQSRLERGDVMGGESQISETAAASGSGSSRSPAGTANAHDGEAEEDVTLTDLGEGKHQWREGRDLIVEYQSHESDEVEVKVFENVFADDEGTMMMKDVEDKLRKEIEAYRSGGIKGAMREAQRSFSPDHQHHSQEVKKISKDIGPHAAAQTASPRLTLGHHTSSEAGPSREGQASSPIKVVERSAVSRTDEPAHRDGHVEDSARTERAHSPIDLEDEDGPLPPTQSSSAVPSSSTQLRLSPLASALKPARDKSARKRVFVQAGRPNGHGRRRDSVRRTIFTSGKRTAPKSTNHHHQDSTHDEEALSSSESTESGSSPAVSTSDLPSPTSTPTTLLGDGGERLRGRAHDVRSGDSMGGMSSRRSSMRPPTRVGSRAGSPVSRIRFADELPSRPETPTSNDPGAGGSTGALVKSMSRSSLKLLRRNTGDDAVGGRGS